MSKTWGSFSRSSSPAMTSKSLYLEFSPHWPQYYELLKGRNVSLSISTFYVQCPVHNSLAIIIKWMHICYIISLRWINEFLFTHVTIFQIWETYYIHLSNKYLLSTRHCSRLCRYDAKQVRVDLCTHVNSTVVEKDKNKKINQKVSDSGKTQ